MVKMNFSSVLSRQCNNDDDFENWSPSSHTKVLLLNNINEFLKSKIYEICLCFPFVITFP